MSFKTWSASQGKPAKSLADDKPAQPKAPPAQPKTGPAQPAAAPKS